MTEPEPLQQINRTYVRYRNRKLSYFSGCDYFRLSSHPAVIKALDQGLEKYGLNVAASRLTTGNHIVYQQLEEGLADFFDAPSALAVSTGYMTNLVVSQALAGSFSHVLLDERAHPSLQDASRLLNCPIFTFRHLDISHLKQTAERCGPGAKVILLTDGMFSHDGAAAPLSSYLQVLPTDAWLLVDDSHAAGVLGQTGKGSLEYERVSRSRIIQTITLSKAFGVYGGAVLGKRTLRQAIIDRSPMFIGSTPLPLPLACAALESLRLLSGDKSFLKRLTANTRRVKAGLPRNNPSVPSSSSPEKKGRASSSKAPPQLPRSDFPHPGPIIGWVPTNPAQSARMSKALLKNSIYPPFLQYPSGPAGGYFRFAISSEHSHAQLDGLLKVLKCVE